MLKGYRGFTREFSRTGSFRALWLQVRTGAAHVARRLFDRSPVDDPIERFLRNYEGDGFRLPDAESTALSLSAELCLVCGLCSAACARAGGAPKVDPRDAVIAAARMAIDWVRLELTPFAPEPDGRARRTRADAEPTPFAPVPDGRASGTRAGPEPAATPCTACRACDDVCPAHIPIHRVQQWLASPRR